MIPSVQMIKKKVVSHEQYDQDSDDELNFMQMQMNGGRTHAKNGKHKNGNNKKSRRQKRNEHIYDDDSDFEEDDKKIVDDKKNANFTKQSFDKVSVPQALLARKKSALSALIMVSSPPNNNQNGYSGRGHHGHDYGQHQVPHYPPESESNLSSFHSFMLVVYFGEYLDETPIKLEISAAWAVKETVHRAIQKWRTSKPTCNLKSSNSSDYSMRCMDEDEIDDDLPAFNKNSKIHQIGETVVGLQYIGTINEKNSNNNASSPNGAVSPKSSGPTLLQFSNAKEQIFIKIGIPGPSNETHVLAVDKDASALTVRDLVSLLNKKKHGAHYHPLFFNFYFQGNTKLSQAINRSEFIVNLKEPRSLILLPRFLNSNDDVNEAYQFKLVRLANERREYHCTKIRNARKNKKRLLIVDRHRIVKKAMDDYNIGTNDHVPIDIATITEIHVSEKNTKQFYIEYKHVQKGGSRNQVYELEQAADCSHIVMKIKYLGILRKLQGI